MVDLTEYGFEVLPSNQSQVETLRSCAEKLGCLLHEAWSKVVSQLPERFITADAIAETLGFASKNVNKRMDRELAAHLEQEASETKTEKNYGSGWLDVSKSAGTAQTENRYLRYNYRVHWRKRRYCKHIGNVKDEKVLKIAQAVRQACDQQKPPHEIVKLIEKMKQEK